MKAYLIPLAVLAALLMSVHASAGILGQPQAAQAEEQAVEAAAVHDCCPVCCTPILNAVRNARARLACLIAPPCGCQPVLSRVRAVLACPPALICRVKAALCCPVVTCDPCAQPAEAK